MEEQKNELVVQNAWAPRAEEELSGTASQADSVSAPEQAPEPTLKARMNKMLKEIEATDS